MYHPLLRRKSTVVTFFSIWALLTVFHFFALFLIADFPIVYSLTDALTSGIIFASISLGLWYAISFGLKNQKNYFKNILSNFLLFILTSAVWHGLSWLIASVFGDEGRDFYMQILVVKLGIAPFLYISIILIYYAINYYESFQQKQEQEMHLKNLVREAQLNELRTQLQPHFLFNSLNSINSLTITNPSKAGEMIIKLSEFLRYSLKQKGHGMTTLEQELYHIQLYLDIETIRFGDRLICTIDIAKDFFSYPLPLMILQPLVENAVKHGVYNTDELVTITITANEIVPFLQLVIQNNYDDTVSSSKGTGTGLTNVRERMRLVYGASDLLKIAQEKNSFTATLLIPQK